MTPSKPQDPGKGKAAEAEQIETDAQESRREVAQAQAAEGQQASEETPAEAKPRTRRRRVRRSAKPKQDETAGGEAEAEAAPAASEGEPPAAESEPVAEPPAAESEPVAESEPAAEAEPGAEPAKTPAAAPRPRRRRARTPGGPQLVRAKARYVRTSARKARMMSGHLRGKTVPEARAILAFAPPAVARDWSRLLNSAVANAENNHELIGDELRVREAFADEGPTLKRYRPRAMGRATPILKRTTHLTITLISEG